MTKTSTSIWQRFWQTQRKPILFFGFIIIAIGLGFYSNYSNVEAAKKWSNQVAIEITAIEEESNTLLKQTDTNGKKTQIKAILKKIEVNTNIANSLNDQVINKSFNLKTYYTGYLDSNKKNLTRIMSNLNIASEIETQDKWEIRLINLLKTDPANNEKITQDYQNGKDLVNKLEEYNKTSSDTTIIGKLVTVIDYYKPILELIDKNFGQLVSKISEIENLAKSPKSALDVFNQITTSGVYTGELINAKSTIIKIIKKINE